MTLLWAGLALAAQDDLYLADVGVTARPPDGWYTEWANYGLDAVDDAKRVQVSVSYDPWQIPADDAAVAAWSATRIQALQDEGHSDVTLASSERAGDAVVMEFSYRYEGNQAAVWLQRSFPVEGRMVHLSATSVSRNRRHADRAMDTWTDALLLDHPAADLADLQGPIQGALGFGMTLPEGWRSPTDTELNAVRSLVSEQLGMTLDAERCVWAAQPVVGDAGVLIACGRDMSLGVVDALSFEGVEETVRADIFGVAADKVVPGAQHAHPDGRLSLVYGLPAADGRSVTMTVTPYDQGGVVLYALSAVDASAVQVGPLLDGLTWDDPAGGGHPVSTQQQIQYMVRYTPTDPRVLGPIGGVVLLLGGLGVFAAKRRKRSFEDED